MDGNGYSRALRQITSTQSVFLGLKSVLFQLECETTVTESKKNKNKVCDDVCQKWVTLPNYHLKAKSVIVLLYFKCMMYYLFYYLLH